MVTQTKYFRIIALVGALFLGGGITYYYFISSSKQSVAIVSGISDFSDQRDTAHIIDIFNKDRYWLVSSPDYDPYHMLSTRSPNKREDKYFGKMTIKVLYQDSQFIGFVAYYLKNMIEGFILFLAVKQEFRGKRYGPQLMEYALNDLKQKGAAFARLVTRTSNLKAQAVYNRLGFKETERDADYVYYLKEL